MQALGAGPGVQRGPAMANGEGQGRKSANMGRAHSMRRTELEKEKSSFFLTLLLPSLCISGFLFPIGVNLGGIFFAGQGKSLDV